MSLVNITILEDKPEVKSGEKNGRAWEIREQAAVLETADRKQPVKIGLAKGAAPFAVGRYTLDLVKSLHVSEFGSIQLSRNLALTPAK